MLPPLLTAHADPERGIGWNPRSAPDPGWNTKRTRVLLDALGAPDRGLRVVLIAGTKGKGSTAALLASVLAADGRRAGLFTGPHLQDFRERIVVDGGVIGEGELESAIERIEPVIAVLRRELPEAGEPTAFELTTAVALDHFARSGCEIAVVEVGLGGRLDATNATEPEISVVTPIGHDHVQILGRRLATIATEKGGILRGGRPALIARQRPAAAAALVAVCRASGALCRVVSPDPTLRTALYGDHHAQNAALAVEAARLLGTTAAGALARGLGQLRWPGRFEVVPGTPEIVLDGAHNAPSAAALATALAAHAGGRSVHLIVGLMRDKDARAVLRALAPIAGSLTATRIALPRALGTADLTRVARQAGIRAVTESTHVAAALDAAPRQGIVCVTGSLALVGEARTALGLPPVARLWDAQNPSRDGMADA